MEGGKPPPPPRFRRCHLTIRWSCKCCLAVRIFCRIAVMKLNFGVSVIKHRMYIISTLTERKEPFC